jgi:hypothetical protein
VEQNASQFFGANPQDQAELMVGEVKELVEQRAVQHCELPRLALHSPRSSALNSRLQEMALAKITKKPSEASLFSDTTCTTQGTDLDGLVSRRNGLVMSRLLEEDDQEKTMTQQALREQTEVEKKAERDARLQVILRALENQMSTGFLAEDVNRPKDVSQIQPLEIVFDDAGQEVTSLIYKRPLGAEFAKRGFASVKVSKVFRKSYAWGLGIKVGWSLKRINGEDFSRNSFQEVQDALRNGFETLPYSAVIFDEV